MTIRVTYEVTCAKCGSVECERHVVAYPLCPLPMPLVRQMGGLDLCERCYLALLDAARAMVYGEREESEAVKGPGRDLH